MSCGRDREELFFHGAMEAFAEAIGFRRVHLNVPMLDLIDGQVKFVRMV